MDNTVVLQNEIDITGKLIMGIITDIQLQKNKLDRFNIFVDDKFLLGVSDIIIVSLGLKIGQELDEIRLTEIVKEKLYEEAWTYGLNYATRSMHSLRQIREKLSKKGYTDDCVDEVIGKLKNYGYVDDVAYARAYIADHKTNYGRKKLAYELKLDGIKESDYKELLDEVDFFEIAKGIAFKYVSKYDVDIGSCEFNSYDEYELRQKVYRYLSSKGFGHNECIYAIDYLRRTI